MEQFEQLLTCAICLDRYRNPKLLPCQHSFCMEPCMDGLVDYVRRQVKCPECRAEHRIPYQGVQGFPTNVTLQRFLELHIEITGELPDPTSGQVMKRCSVCSEKAYVGMCVHCEKEICGDCKGAHMDILRREISRINNQVRRAMHRLQDMLGLVEKNMLALQTNCTSVSEEVDEIYRRLNKALKDRTEYLRSEVDRYLTTELKNLNTLKDNLETEISNIQSNCDLADKHMQSEEIEWDDCELMDAKDIFLKTIEFIRNFEAETGDYTRKVRFLMAHDPNTLVMNVSGYGDLSINMPHQFLGVQQSQSAGGMLQPPGPGLMRSKSDHRLASQFRQQEERGYERGYEGESGRVSPLGGRKFGERPPVRNTGDQFEGGSRYGRNRERGEYGADYENPYDNDGNRSTARSRIRARMNRHAAGDSDDDTQGGRSVRFTEGGSHPQQKERERVLDTEDVAKGLLSGIIRLSDSPRVMKRLQDSEIKKDKPPPAPAPIEKFQPPKRPVAAAQRQVSEEDEVTKIKRLMKNAPGEPTTTAPEPTRPAAERVSALKRSEDSRDDQTQSSPVSSRSPSTSEHPSRKPSQEVSSEEETDEGSSVSSIQQAQRKTVGSKSTPTPGSRRSSASSDVTASGPRLPLILVTPTLPTSVPPASVVTHTGAVFSTAEVKRKFEVSPKEAEPKKPFVSRFLKSAANRASAGTTSSPSVTEKAKVEEDDEDESSSESSDSEETDSEEESDDKAGKAAQTKPVEKTDIGPLLARSAQARDTGSGTSTRRSSRDEGYTSRWGEPYRPKEESKTPTSILKRRESQEQENQGYRFTDKSSIDATEGKNKTHDKRSSYAKSKVDESKGSTGPRYGDSSSYQSRYGNKDDSSSTTSSSYLRSRNTEPEPEPASSRYGSSGFQSRFLNKSKSSAAVSPEEEAPERKFSTAGTDDSRYSGTARSRYSALKDRKSRLARSKSSHNFGADDEEDPDETTSPAAYMAAKGYGTSGSDLSRSRSTHTLKSRENSPERSTNTAGTSGGEKDGAALSSWARYLKNKYGNRGKDGKDTSSGTASRRLSLGLPLRTNSSDDTDDQKNLAGSPTSPTQVTAPAAGSLAPRRSQPEGLPQAAASFSRPQTTLVRTLPNGVVGTGFVAVGTKNQYLQKRRMLFKVGSRGSEPGCFTWPRGIAVAPDNSIVVADSSNHRVQVFDSNGIFSKEFGSYGNAEGEFDCLAGVAVNRIGQFIIADRYNHRIQVMDPSGRFLRSFGAQGTADGRFNYPWGITTDALGFIYVCDKENHRVQVFQSDGTFVGKFGSHGSKVGQLEHPHYIAVSNTNKVIVSDSNNHRVQIFDVNGRVLNSFGSEGSEDGQFKFPRNESPSSSDSSSSELDGSGSGRPRVHHRRRLRKQPDPDLQPGRKLPESVRKLGVRRQRVQGVGGSGRDEQREHPGMRSRESPSPGLLRSTEDSLHWRSQDEEAIHGRLLLRTTTSRTPTTPTYSRSISLDDEFLRSPSSTTSSVTSLSVLDRPSRYKPLSPSETQKSFLANPTQSQINIEMARQNLAKVRDHLEQNITHPGLKSLSYSETQKSDQPRQTQSQVNIEIARHKLAKVRDSLEQDIANPTMKSFPFLSTKSSYRGSKDSLRSFGKSKLISPSLSKDALEFQNSFTVSSKGSVAQNPIINEKTPSAVSRNLPDQPSCSISSQNYSHSFKIPDIHTPHETILLTSNSSSASCNSRYLNSRTRPRFQSSLSFDETRIAASATTSVQLSHTSPVRLSSHPDLRPSSMESLTSLGARAKLLANPLPGRRPAPSTIPSRRLSSRRTSIL